MSLVVVLAAVPARLAAVPLADVAAQWPVVLNLLAGSLAGAWLGAAWATRMATATLYKVLAGLLVFLAVVFAAERVGPLHPAELTEPVQIVAGVVAGFGIGVVAAVIGVAGGEVFLPAPGVLFAVGTQLPRAPSPLGVLPAVLGG